MTTIPTSIMTTIPTTISTTITTTFPITLTTDINKTQELECSYNFQNTSYSFLNCESKDIYDIINSEIISNYKNESLIIQSNDNFIFQITNEENELNALNGKSENKYNLSIIELGQCEKLLKQAYNLKEDISLIILKYEKLTNLSYEKKVEYEIYNPKTKKKMNLNVCRNLKINVNIPANILEKNLFKYNASHEYYKDLCFPHSTESKTDIILTDRRKEYINNNMSLCENSCEYNGYNSSKKNIICECNIKTKLNLFLQTDNYKEELMNTFKDYKNLTNILVVKCYKLFFCKKGMIKNIGSYILLSIIFLNILLLIILLIKRKAEINKIIEQFVEKKKKNPVDQHKKKEKTSFKDKIKFHHYKNKRNSINIKNDEKKVKIDIAENNNNSKYKFSKFSSKEHKIKKQNNPPKRKKNINIIKTSGELSSKSFSKIELKSLKKEIILKNKEQIKLNDYELNNLLYEDALKIDKRTYFQFYFSLIKRKQLILFVFYTVDDYNSKILKISLFLFSFSLYYVVNTLFFTDSTLHKIYIDKGVYNIIFQLPQIFYSSLISNTANIIVNYLSLSEKDILEIKNERKNKRNKASKVFKWLNVKFVVYFIFDFSILIIFWYFLGCFCAVYKNTQVHLIKDTLICFGISTLYPFGLCLIPGIFRIPSLRNKEKKKECLYNFSKYLHLL